MTRTGLPTPADMAETIDLLRKSTGHTLFGARLALAEGEVGLAYRCCQEHGRQIRLRYIPSIDPVSVERKGLDPTELLRREAQLQPHQTNPRSTR